MNYIDAMKQALETILLVTLPVNRGPLTVMAINDLRRAIEQAEKQEPVAWQGLTREETVSLARQHLGGMPIGREFVDAVEVLLREKNTAQPQPQRQPLTMSMLLAMKRHEDRTGYTAGWNDALDVLAARAHGIGGEA